MVVEIESSGSILDLKAKEIIVQGPKVFKLKYSHKFLS